MSSACGNVYGKQNQEKLIISPEKVSGRINTMLLLMYLSSGLVSKTDEHAKKTKEEL